VKPPKDYGPLRGFGFSAGSASPRGLPAFQVTYDEGVKVGYKWYDAENKPVLFPFGFGLSYTTYSIFRPLESDCRGRISHVTFTVTNTGATARERK
jgi:beta-glucosidase